MDNSRNNDGGCSRQRDPHPQFGTFSAASLKPLQLELGRSLLPFSTPVCFLHQDIRQGDASRIGEGGYNKCGVRLVETNSSLTPLDIYCHSGQDGGSASTSGITPCSWASLLSDFKVPSLSNFGETLNSNSNATSVPRNGRLESYGDSHHRQSGRLRHADADGEQMVPVNNFNVTSDATAFSNSSKARSLFQAQSSQFSNSWPVEERGLGNTLQLVRGGECGGFVGSDEGSFTACKQGPKLTPGQTDEAGPSNSSPFSLPSVIYSNSPIYAPRPSYSFARVADEFKGKNKVDDLRDMNLEEHGIGGNSFGRNQQDITRIPVGMGPHGGNRRRGLPDFEGLNSMRPAARGDSEDFGAKACTNWNEDIQPMNIDTQQFSTVEPVEPGDKVGTRQGSEAEYSTQVNKQSRLRTLGVQADEAGLPGFIKRSRQHPNDSSWKVWGGDPEDVRQGEQESDVGTNKVQTCNWLQRWLPPNSSLLTANPDGSSKLDFSGLCYMQANRSSIENMREGHEREWDRFQYRPTGFSSKGGPFEFSPLSTPSASALAIIGTASRCLRPALTQNKGSIMMQPSDTKMLKVKHVRFAEPQRSS